MAIRRILKYGEGTLRQPSKEVFKVSKKIQDLVHDMIETMYSANGVGLAAPQIGENLRIFVIDVSSDKEPLNPIVFINPKIIKKSGSICSQEGCLSFPEVYSDVKRAEYVMVKATDIKGRSFVIEGKDGSLLARAIQHEFDHLDGVLFIDRCTDVEKTEQELAKNNLPKIQPEKLIKE
ncbi:MAG: peptide deformylase [Fusobacterium sp.]|nr:peptide deformylase [Fusobacterium sp.]